MLFSILFGVNPSDKHAVMGGKSLKKKVDPTGERYIITTVSPGSVAG
jgi:hypothetical protein